MFAQIKLGFARSLKLEFARSERLGFANLRNRDLQIPDITFYVGGVVYYTAPQPKKLPPLFCYFLQFLNISTITTSFGYRG